MTTTVDQPIVAEHAAPERRPVDAGEQDSGVLGLGRMDAHLDTAERNRIPQSTEAWPRPTGQDVYVLMREQ